MCKLLYGLLGTLRVDADGEIWLKQEDVAELKLTSSELKNLARTAMEIAQLALELKWRIEQERRQLKLFEGKGEGNA